MTAPRRRFSMPNMAARQAWNVPSTLVRSTAAQSSSAIIISDLSRVTPAEVTAASIGPSSSSTRRTKVLTAAESATSAWTARIRAPDSAAVCSVSVASAERER